MSAEVLLIDPIFKERVWGGMELREWFGPEVPASTVGEAWVISGMPGDSGLVRFGPGAGGTLDEAWKAGLITGSPREDEFPILVKFLDPADWLSVQVHPNDAEAEALEGDATGKAECWYAVQADDGAEIILGHTAEDVETLREAMDQGRLDDHLIHEPVLPGSFFMVPAGVVHAVGPGMLIYEVQQSSDTTYRLYDFNRPGLDGKPRELHVEKGFGVIRAPYDATEALTAGPEESIPGGVRRVLVAGDHFTVIEYAVEGIVELPATDTFLLGSIVRGAGAIIVDGANTGLSRGDSFVVTSGAESIRLHGNGMFVIVEPGEVA